MIYYIVGKLADVQESAVVIEAGGIGYLMGVSGQTVNDLTGKTGSEIKMWVRQRVTDDEILWYGFLHKKERDVFEKLLSVSGVGPKSALSILNLGEVEVLTQAIDQSNVGYISQAVGVGKKTAQRILIELKGKLVMDDMVDSDIEQAMKALGYKRHEYEHLAAMVPLESSLEEKITWLVKQM